MALLTRDQILKADDRAVQEVPVPEWGGEVLVRGLDGRGRDGYFASMTVMRGGRQQINADNATAKLVALCILDPDDEQREQLMFSITDVEELGNRSGAALNRVFEVAQKLSGLSDEDMAELGKDSPNTPNVHSISDSRKRSGSRSPSS